MKGIKFVAAILGLLLVIGSGIALAAGDEGAGPAQATALSAPPKDEPGVEIKADRTATSKTFQLPDGSLETRIFETPINYRDENDEWKPIEEGFEQADGATLTNGDNRFDVTLPAQMGTEPVRLSVGEDWVPSQLLGPASEAVQLEDGSATYEAANSETSFDFSTLANGLKENIEIADPSQPSTFHFELSASAGVTPALIQDGSIEFRDEDGHLVATLPAPVMSDSSRGPAGISRAIEYKLEPGNSGNWLLTVEASREWLNQPDRKWPVQIDPTVVVPQAYFDCMLASAPSIETGNFCAANGFSHLWAQAWYYSSGLDEFTRSVVFYRLIGLIPSTASVTSATMSLYSGHAAESTTGVELQSLLQPWSNYVSWKYSGYPNCYTCAPWTTPGGYAEPGAGQLSTTARGGSGAGWWNIPLKNQMVQRWVSGSSSENYGVLVKQLGEKERQCTPTCVHRTLEFESSAGPVAENRPHLSIVYIPQASADSKVTSPLEGTRSAKRFKLAAAWTHQGVTGVTFQHKSPEGWVNVPQSKVTDKNNQVVKEWPAAVEGGAQHSEPLYWNAPEPNLPAVLKGQVRAVLTGAIGADGYTAPVEVELNRDIGGPKDATAAVGPGTVDLLTGNLTVSRTDVAIPGFGSALEFSRSHSSRDAEVEQKGVLGQGWKPGTPVEEAGGAAFRSIREVNITEEGEEGEPYTFTYAILTDLEGYEYAFDKVGGSYVTPPEASGWVLAAEGANRLALTDSGGNRTVFDNGGAGAEYLPVSVSQTGGSTNKTQMFYQLVGGNRRLSMVIAPTAAGVSCSEAGATATPGCHVLTFAYKPATAWGGEASMGERLAEISYYAATSGTTMGKWEVANYTYDSKGRLVAEWDPRISPVLKETYSYETGGQLHTITPPGEEPWTMEYGTVEGEQADGRLMNVKRASLLASPSVAQTTIAYGVPVSGSGGPYDLSPGTVGQWGQQDLPTDATAIFPPDQVPANPPTSYSRATVYYMDVEGQLSNTATPSGAGTSAASITTAESDEHGNVVRELSAQNRLRALAEGSEKSAARSHQLETKRLYSADGTQLQEEWGPEHQVRLESGTTAKARLHRIDQYDEGAPTPPPGTPMPHLPTRETSGASIVGQGNDADQRVTEFRYDWTLRKPTETIVDPSGLNIRTKTVYDSVSGLPIEQRQPSNTGGGGAGTTKIIYWGPESPEEECKGAQYANLPCKVLPAAQPGTPGQPELLVRKFRSYSLLGQPTEVIESPGGSAGNTRKTIVTYDNAGRPTSKKQEGGGTAVPQSEVLYSSTTGRPTTQRFACESSCTPQYTSSFGAAGSGNGQFAHAADVALDAKGNLWVADQNNHRIQEFNEKGEFIKAFGSAGTGNGQFTRPKSIAFDAKGNFWVADSGNSRLEQFNEKGEFLKAVGSAGSGNGQFSGPESIAIDAKGNIWVADTYNYRVQELNEKGEFIKVVNPSGMGAIEPTGLDVGPGGNVWVADWAHNHIVELSEAGGFVRQFGSGGTGNGQFAQPDTVTVDSQGTVWVGDEGNGRVQGFNQNGEYVTQFGSKGSGAGQFSFGYPLGMAADAKGNLWITDTNNNRVQKWNTIGFDSQAATTTYDALGRVTAYEDADGNKATMTYDLLGRPVTTNDGRGTQTRIYDPTSGLLTELQDSAAGTFTASYDADGNMVERGLPDGLVAKTTYDEAGQRTHLSYTKTSNCGASCTWLDFGAEGSIYGQILSQTSTLSSQLYSYDKAGRLINVNDTPQGGSCTTRAYSYDEDSNRKSLVTRSPGLGGACATSGGTTQSYSYDSADRLLGTGLAYDNFGRIINLPESYAGGKALSTSFFSNDLVASQSQGGITNTFQLDSTLRQRQRIQGGGLEGTEVFHYADESDSPAWTERGSIWTRNIVGIGGELAAIQDSSTGTTLRLTNLHGDIIATASLSQTATGLIGTSEYDEFGNPVKGSSARFGWLGGKQRRTELPSGVIQMGARSYVPAIGRFISTDPISAGSANAYDYANADPVNEFDLEGDCPKSRCLGRARAAGRISRRSSASGAAPAGAGGATTAARPSAARVVKSGRMLTSAPGVPLNALDPHIPPKLKCHPHKRHRCNGGGYHPPPPPPEIVDPDCIVAKWEYEKSDGVCGPGLPETGVSAPDPGDLG
jgi:RHS repeat-associated protein